MTTLNNVVAIFVAFVLFGSVVPADAQTRAERDAYRTLDRAVQAVQSDPTPDRIATLRREIQSAYSVFQRQEQRVKAADDAMHRAYGQHTFESETDRVPQSVIRAGIRIPELLGRSTATYLRARGLTYRAFWDAHGQDWAFYLRNNVYTGMDTLREAATAVATLASSIPGVSIPMVQRLVSANQAVLREQGRILSDLESIMSGDIVYDSMIEPIPAMVSAATAVADGLQRRQRADYQDRDTFIEAERRIEQEQQQEQIRQQQQEQERAEQIRTGAVTNRAEFDTALSQAMFDALQAARGVQGAQYWNEAHPHHERGDRAVARAYSLINGRAGYVPTGTLFDRDAFLRQLQVYQRQLGECPNKPRRR